MAIACVGALLLSCTASAAGAERFSFYGFQATAFCNGSGIVPKPPQFSHLVPDFGFAIIGAADGRVQATVSFEHIPNQFYSVRLIQSDADCAAAGWTGFSDDHGRVTVHISEPAVSSTAFVAVDQFATFNGMVFELNESLVTETYRH